MRCVIGGLPLVLLAELLLIGRMKEHSLVDLLPVLLRVDLVVLGAWRELVLIGTGHVDVAIVVVVLVHLVDGV